MKVLKFPWPSRTNVRGREGLTINSEHKIVTNEEISRENCRAPLLSSRPNFKLSTAEHFSMLNVLKFINLSECSE